MTTPCMFGTAPPSNKAMSGVRSGRRGGREGAREHALTSGADKLWENKTRTWSWRALFPAGCLLLVRTGASVYHSLKPRSTWCVPSAALSVANGSRKKEKGWKRRGKGVCLVLPCADKLWENKQRTCALTGFVPSRLLKPAYLSIKFKAEEYLVCSFCCLERRQWEPQQGPSSSNNLSRAWLNSLTRWEAHVLYFGHTHLHTHTHVLYNLPECSMHNLY